MPILSSDIKYYLTPAANDDPDLSLGGVGNGSEISASINNIFDDVTPEEALDGSVEYRAISVKNTNISLTLYGAKIWISTETSSTDDTIALAYDSAGTQSVVNETTAPSSPTLTFTTPTTKATGIALGDIAAGASKRVWLRRTVTAGAAAATSSGALTCGGGTV